MAARLGSLTNHLPRVEKPDCSVKVARRRIKRHINLALRKTPVLLSGVDPKQ